MTSSTTWQRWTACALLAILAASSSLTGCATASPPPRESPSLYQPPVLRLPQGRPVETQDGVYTPPAPEVWHSDARYRHLEQQLEAALIALAQERNRNR